MSTYRINRYGDVFTAPLAESTWRQWELYRTSVVLQIGSCEAMEFAFVGDKHGQTVGSDFATVARRESQGEYSLVLHRKTESGDEESGGIARLCNVQSGTTATLLAVH